ncbi:hypothetical protein A2276_05895 [candidate division WOR-1 bacterium RIFOXYA12_FULL_43_27]|uniref:Cupin 2 conserved barrel domain-containing protein n=1 Tax=candidate division WOR-1 bacterium RIFOXYC2_FULL_46_14 TaxID=1802587 RepID=A0A1F4U3Q0_UNCSA|nr:MAG: hypothetical protein A2276_05895 [candidate division WOR-1 bacterium RIFOXYA12_FULL_43_27]OGC20194.1 MAG: hypothetical protein A2292_03895 [candidate division WOR-1 bacterium RIFOXYB2_FULL_46_45]OGC32068.1 MAG: hypothetical protein A2232_07550 [candidate division WOR-1 bacterium RIFOXYA2_FULL_46_56]OGC39470.1 MAG: hypothetical protein A2438_07915 [candidate division WOR-1 bacterium RIFOXYC2_FULL_46_14]
MLENIIHNDTVIAIIVYKDHKQEGIQFLSPNKYPLQLGYMTRPNGYRISPHIHNPVHRNTIGTQEVLFIKSGEIRIDFYSFEQEFLESRKLSAGDTILLAGAGHGIEVLQEAEIIEVKNGPYIEGADKGRFEGKRSTDDSC